MAADGWFAKYSPGGRFLMRGSQTPSISGRVIGDNGISGAWLDDHTALIKAHHAPEGLYSSALPFFPPMRIADAVNHVDARNGKWVGAAIVNGVPTVRCSDGREWVGFGGGDSGCAIGASGDIFLLKHDDGSVWRVPAGTGVPQWMAPLGANIRACDDVFVWAANGRIYGWNPASGGFIENLTVLEGEGWPVPFRVGPLRSGPFRIEDTAYWVLTITNARCIVRPWGSTSGIEVDHTGSTFYPDAVDKGDGRIWVAWSTGDGTPMEQSFDPTALVPLVADPLWFPMDTLVDALPFLVPDDLDSPRVLSGDGLTPAMQTWRGTTGRSFTRVKWGAPRAVEAYRWDDTYVHLFLDATDGKGYDHAWRYTETEWVKRLTHVGATVSHPGARIVRKQGDGPSVFEHNTFGTRVHAYGSNIEMGGSLGLCRVLIIAAIPDPGRTNDQYEERHWFAMSQDGAKRYGLVRYEEVRHGAIVDARSASFTSIILDGSVPPAPLPSIPDPPVTPPVPEEPPMKSRDQFYSEFKEVNDYYAAEEGLKRPGGMVLGDGACDVEAMGKWGYDLLASDKSPAACKHEIARMQEWRDKHPGEAPPSFV